MHKKEKVGNFTINKTAYSLRRCLFYIHDFARRHQIQMSDFFYRGEAQDHGDSTLDSKLYRPNIYKKNPKYLKCTNNNLFSKPFVKLSKLFHRELNTAKDTRINTDFMAYCQHYGLPTPLLDVTTSVLVGLYFACCRETKKPGFLFLFNKNNFLKYPSNYLSYKNCRDYNSINPYKNIKAIYLSVKDYKAVYPEYFNKLANNLILNFHKYVHGAKTYFKCVNPKSWIVLYINKFNNLNDLYNHLDYPSNKDDKQLMKSYENFLNSIGILNNNNKIRLEHSFDKMDLLTSPLLYTFYIYITNLKNILSDKFVPSGLHFWIDTHNDWDRIKAQRGCFILEYPSHKVFSNNIIENINPNYVIKLQNKRHIMKELDNVSINCATLFNDPDNIAKYIYHKYI